MICGFLFHMYCDSGDFICGGTASDGWIGRWDSLVCEGLVWAGWLCVLAHVPMVSVVWLAVSASLTSNNEFLLHLRDLYLARLSLIYLASHRPITRCNSEGHGPGPKLSLQYRHSILHYQCIATFRLFEDAS